MRGRYDEVQKRVITTTSSRNSRERDPLTRPEPDRTSNYSGLCSNCEHVKSCAYPSSITDTWFCEEYSFSKGETVVEAVQELPILGNSELVGLCVNCELRTSCTFPKPQGGVWFCGEYQ